ncbi:hypothetical protein GYMLUDRAFT_77643 [Collybiopsis luxurians FD-317 M1]|uniref:Uncharacterized protein n=1 Tax=Collybiopsis luxurians FD-317 M1 TaxID=944289 RepID=A0A0D0BEG6_9AGAR|nr:hypothetical protein GYMLUDRAFT_77643 [Collybiopsis luxurians FD-317 M1]
MSSAMSPAYQAIVVKVFVLMLDIFSRAIKFMSDTKHPWTGYLRIYSQTLVKGPGMPDALQKLRNLVIHEMNDTITESHLQGMKTQVIASAVLDKAGEISQQMTEIHDLFRSHPALMNAKEASLHNSPYLVALHQHDSVNVMAFGDREAAQVVYNGVSKNWAKVLTYRRYPRPLASHGLESYVQQCLQEIKRLPPLDYTVPPHEAQYIVAFHCNHVQKVGFRKVEDAWALYEALS